MHASTNTTPAVAIWLYCCAIMIFIMVILGGATRLTHSGLSMVEWHPIKGVFPPITESAWQDAFQKYQQYPEFNIQNPSMQLHEFKSIFWMEFTHRIWGRAIGLVFFIPFVYFLLKRQLTHALIVRLFCMFILGGMQGVLGWFMVKSGLSDQANVSQYRLATHLILAFLLYGWIFWTATQLLQKPHQRSSDQSYKNSLSGLIILLLITVISGGFVAGTHAGLIYNSYPMMGDTLVPKALFSLQPWGKNFFENMITIQFTHRLLTATVLIYTLALYIAIMLQNISPRTRIAGHCLLATVILQFTLGVTTLILQVPTVLAVAHQAGALLLFTAMLWLKNEYCNNSITH
ncbi:Heme A synthase, cytochrome oxidase biogenesis protein Cox15-CtaA [uncultured Candidatus Thioglobus sp.]|nr:Heme A synthase, cytochrome oxidase biogenesis protein Cox15-CtaA [uncultured Candidatus Thioglobus sp.]